MPERCGNEQNEVETVICLWENEAVKKSGGKKSKKDEEKVREQKRSQWKDERRTDRYWSFARWLGTV